MFHKIVIIKDLMNKKLYEIYFKFSLSFFVSRVAAAVVNVVVVAVVAL
jgi:hypothetical protein